MNLHQTTGHEQDGRDVKERPRQVRYLDTGMGAREPDEPVICRICDRPILKGEPRYREPEGDVHLDCRTRTRALSGKLPPGPFSGASPRPS